MAKNSQVMGLSELQNRIARLAKRASPAQVGKGLARGAEVVEREAKTNIKRHDLILTGDLRASMRYIIRENRTGADALVGTDKIYAKTHEFGATITPKSSPFLVFEVDGNLIFARSVTIPERPFLRPAIDNNRAEILEAIGKGLQAQILP